MSQNCEIGLIGLAVMGQNLVRNMARNGFKVAVYNRTTSKTKEFVEHVPEQGIAPGYTLEEFVGLLQKPRRIMLMVQAGKAVDAVIDELLPLLSPGDLIIDGGNSFFKDTIRRTQKVEAAGLMYMGAGVSGGEEGALNGPSIMPGGTQEAWKAIGPIFRTITDKLRISREKLAYIVDSTTAAVPTLCHLSAWGAYILGLIATYYAEVGYNGNPTHDFLSGVPYQYYTIGSIVMVFIIAVTGWDYGPMKKAEDRALLTGKLFEEGSEIKEREETKLPEGAHPTIWNMIVPLVILLVLIFVGLFYTGDVKTNGILGALANGSSLRALVIAFFLTACISGAMSIKSSTRSWGVRSSDRYGTNGTCGSAFFMSSPPSLFVPPDRRGAHIRATETKKFKNR